MSLTAGDVISVEDRQTYLGEQVINVYYFQVVSFEPLVDLADLADVFTSDYVAALLPVQHLELAHNRIIVRNLTNGLDIHEKPLAPIVGLNAGDPGNSLLAYSIRLVRSTAATRHGSKRIGGVPENASVGNLPTSQYATALALVCETLGVGLERSGTVDEDFITVPVIVGRFPTGDPNAGELDLSVLNPIASAQFIRITSQVSRRAGRGV